MFKEYEFLKSSKEQIGYGPTDFALGQTPEWFQVLFARTKSTYNEKWRLRKEISKS